MSILQGLALEVGFGRPLIRASVAAGVVGGIIWLTKPSYFFRPDGSARPSEFLTWIKTEDSSFFPWYAPAIGVGVVAGGLM